MSWLRRVMGFEAPPKAATPDLETRALGLANGKRVSIDPDLDKTVSPHLCQPAFSGVQCVWSSGEIELGHGHFLHRFYLDDDETWIQVHTSGGLDGSVEEVTLFSYVSADVVNSQSELARLAGPDSPIGLPQYSYCDRQFERVWGTEEGQTELVAYQEKVTSPDQRYGIKHHAMLYARDTELHSRREFLLFSAEEDEEGTVTLTTSVGVSLFQSDLTVSY
ncbi:DUF2491 family protein [Pseudomonas aeruginosa]|jgi:hypothetical protein|uniref:DUF2491 domain-containing protein n=1 Tax=Pseudomonas saponiphila TaxID=556534 RepID=A0A1H4ZNZ3_9PSED|nr:DUF2491 family protein [Pseudomonas saponiphila]SED31595.1 Protein of unknown function [Pseudomonas saponiphila]